MSDQEYPDSLTYQLTVLYKQAGVKAYLVYASAGIELYVFLDSSLWELIRDE